MYVNVIFISPRGGTALCGGEFELFGITFCTLKPEGRTGPELPADFLHLQIEHPQKICTPRQPQVAALMFLSPGGVCAFSSFCTDVPQH